MQRTPEQKRQIASLQTLGGWSLILHDIVEMEKDNILDRLLAGDDDRDKLASAAVELRTLHKTLRRLREYPQQMIKQLEEEGDSIYG